MSKQNVELLNSMEVDERLDYAEKLVFATDGIEQDLSAGMHVIKSEAQAGNPKAEFLMYKVNMSKGKSVAAINWLKSSYKKGYGEALAMAYFEYDRGKLRGFKEKELMASLENAAKINIPVANYFMGILSENKNKEQEAERYFSLAMELGFDESYLDFTGYEEECRDMNMLDFRGLFQREWLPVMITNNFEAYFDAICEKKVDELIQYIWSDMIKNCDRNPEDYPLEFQAETFSVSDDGIYYTIIQMTELPKSKGRNLAIYAMVVFDAEGKREPRIFLGETDYNNLDRFIFVAEPVHINDQYEHRNFGPLYDEENVCFLKPVNPEKELDAFIDRCLAVYISEENKLKSIGHKIKNIFKRK